MSQLLRAQSVAQIVHHNHVGRGGRTMYEQLFSISTDPRLQTEGEIVVAFLHESCRYGNCSVEHLTRLGFTEKTVRRVGAITPNLGEGWIGALERNEGTEDEGLRRVILAILEYHCRYSGGDADPLRALRQRMRK